jgi:hypothetical protein
MRVAVLLAVAAVAAALASSAGAVAPIKLIGVVGPGFTITLKDGTGKAVKSLKAGAYTISINDKSDIHDFHLMGPGVNKSTSVPAKVQVIWAVALKKGIYRYVCDPHKTIMKGSFTVM